MTKSDTVGEGRPIRASKSRQQGYKAGTVGDEDKGGHERDGGGVGQRKLTERVQNGSAGIERR